MWLRRSFYYAQFGAIPILPLWLLIGRGIVIDGTGWEFVMLLFVAPILAVVMLIVAGLTVARKSVRRSRAVSWLDVGLLAAWYLAIIAAGFVAHPIMAVLVVLLAFAVFWSAVWQLYTETRRRVRSAFAGFTAIPAGNYEASRSSDPGASGRSRVIRIDPKR
jgi:peptidoglycan/LPS O-acetylase OafA/YrhL